MDNAEIMDIDGPEFLESIHSDIVHYRNDINYGAIARMRQCETELTGTREQSLICTSVAILDTNFLISNLAYVKRLLNEAQAYPGRLVLIVPWTVVHELDGLKKCASPGDTFAEETKTATLARTAMWFLESVLREKCPSLRGQKSWELHDAEAKHARGDDSILDCCLFFQALGSFHVTLLSNDRNLAIKAMIHDIHSLSAESKERKDAFLARIPHLPSYPGPLSYSSRAIPGTNTITHVPCQAMDTEPADWQDEDIDMETSLPDPVPPPLSRDVVGLWASKYAPDNIHKTLSRSPPSTNHQARLSSTKTIPAPWPDPKKAV